MICQRTARLGPYQQAGALDAALVKALWPGLLLAVLFFSSGVPGLQVQSAQTGVSPIWPPSGITLAVLIIAGYRAWPGVIAGMLALALYAGVPPWLALIAGAATVAESVLPLMLARRLGFEGRLHNVPDILLFIGIATLGPLLSAATAGLALHAFLPSPGVPAANVVLTWWIGNSLGMLMVGGTVLTLRNVFWRDALMRHWLETLLIAAVALGISIVGLLLTEGVASALCMNLLIPMVFLAAMRTGALAALLPGLIALLTLLALAPHVSTELLDMPAPNVLTLNLVNIWFTGVVGLVVAAAYRDHRIHSQTHWLAHNDALTGIPNRLAMDNRIRQSIGGKRRGDASDNLLFLDLDQMKAVNDKAGHAAGDLLLKKVGQLLVENVRDTDLVARWGGDEFAILLSNCQRGDAVRIADKILRELRAMRFSLGDGADYSITASIGVTAASDQDTPESLMARADGAAYEAKRAGRNRVIYRSPP
ncbi:MAG: diguanylate cyclase [Thiohalocapsa sp.]|nr:diguanylate cyclase [Thiohalocapsa sp.]MCF7990539.1 diguanylate cyclase [Thiohalocapsa sp.]